MNYAFIDYENLKGNKLKHLIFDENLIIYFFYTNSDTKIDLSVIEHITKNKSIIKCYKVSNGTQNALDFQLSTFLGYIIGKHKDTINQDEYIIYSEDTGFDKVVSFWKEKYNINIKRVYNHTINDIDTSSFKCPHVTPKDFIGINLFGYEDVVVNVCNHLVSKNEIHNELDRITKNSKLATKIYHNIKPILVHKGYC